MTPRLSAALVLLVLVAVTSQPQADVTTQLPIGLEQSGYTRITSSAEVSAFLETAARLSPLAGKQLLGHSAGGRPLEALLLSSDPAFVAGTLPGKPRLTILLVGGQHGTEPAGTEGLLLVIRELLFGRLRPLLANTDFIIVPNSNPDGRDEHHRVNAHGVNLSTDYSLLSEPESRILNDVLMRWQPQAMLDIHESALLKRKTLGAEGYLTDWEAQFEIANNPNINAAIHTLSKQTLLPAVIAGARAAGVPAQHYIGEITTTTQPITNGGLSIRNLRNKAGMIGTFSFLVENRLDPPGDYPSYRNLKERRRKQAACIESFIKVIDSHRAEIQAKSTSARTEPLTNPMLLNWAYVPVADQATVQLQLRRVSDQAPVQITFADHRRIEGYGGLAVPAAYAMADPPASLIEFLALNRIPFHRLAAPRTVAVERQTLMTAPPPPSASDHRASGKRLVETITLPIGSLWVEVSGLTQWLVPLLLETRSSASVFAQPGYRALTQQQPFPVVRVLTAAD